MKNKRGRPAWPPDCLPSCMLRMGVRQVLAACAPTRRTRGFMLMSWLRAFVKPCARRRMHARRPHACGLAQPQHAEGAAAARGSRRLVSPGEQSTADTGKQLQLKERKRKHVPDEEPGQEQPNKKAAPPTPPAPKPVPAAAPAPPECPSASQKPSVHAINPQTPAKGTQQQAQQPPSSSPHSPQPRAAAQPRLQAPPAAPAIPAAARRPSALSAPLGAVTHLLQRAPRPAEVVSRMLRGPIIWELRMADLQRVLSPTTWLNDEGVNFYLRLVQDRNDSAHHASPQPAPRAAAPAAPPTPPPGRPSLSPPPRVWCASSFLYTQLTNVRTGGYANVRRWTLPARTNTPDCVLGRDLLLLPVNFVNSHWVLVALWPARRLMQYYDSLGGAGRTPMMVMQQLEQWYIADAADKGIALPPTSSQYSSSDSAAEVGSAQTGRTQSQAAQQAAAGSAPSRTEQDRPQAASPAAGPKQGRSAGSAPATRASMFKKVVVQQGVPRQGDGAACGVFACAYAQLLAAGVEPPWNFSQADIGRLRRGIAAEMLAQKISQG
uniref:Ubiquitin-like protease family profile domain-containing protein n=1 Tax=Chlamydomonas leiostraca TaxID=1034604 RepID=A0A7S0WQN0_9CHLO